ncbi:MAG: UbiD family decarboxylase [Methanomassiliicoccales archaeon]|jgi:UbiD family decarboxylase|nr:UbiD family decarboxylase [Methanomassiliicoccales archaeon]
MSMRSIVISMDGVSTINYEVPLEYGAARILSSNPSVPVRFMNLNGHEAVGNLWSDRERIAAYFHIRKEEIIKKMLHAISHPTRPIEVDRPQFFDNIKESFDLRELPIPKLFPGDAGRYVTAAVAVAEFGGKRNLSFHRLMLLDDRRFAIRLVPRHLYTMYKSSISEGKDLPVAFCIGVCPSILLAAATSLEYGQDEMEIASSLRQSTLGDPVHVASTKSGILVPAYSEFVLEGRITAETAEEGPFVDITGTYDKKRMQPVVEIDTIYSVDSPMFHIVLPGSIEHYMLMGLPREPLIYRTVNQVVPYVHNVRLTEGGCCWLHGIVSITKNKEGDGVNAIMAAFTGHPSMKKVTIVDNDIDVYDDREVEWAVATRFQAKKGLIVIDDAAGSTLDPSSDGLTSKVGIDATKPMGGEGFDRVKAP